MGPKRPLIGPANVLCFIYRNKSNILLTLPVSRLKYSSNLKNYLKPQFIREYVQYL